MFKPTANRRQFLTTTGSAFAALLASGCMTRGAAAPINGTSFVGYGPLKIDPEGLLDLPEGFSYRVLSSLGDLMDDGGTVPDKKSYWYEIMSLFRRMEPAVQLLRVSEHIRVKLSRVVRRISSSTLHLST